MRCLSRHDIKEAQAAGINKFIEFQVATFVCFFCEESLFLFVVLLIFECL